MTTEDHNDELINVSDFDSIHLRVAVRNQATGDEFRDMDEKHLFEVRGQGLVFSFPPDAFKADNYAVIEIARCNSNYEVIEHLLHATARAAEVVEEKDASQRVVLQLIQIDPKEWELFLKVFQSRQAAIEQFFMSQKA